MFKDISSKLSKIRSNKAAKEVKDNASFKYSIIDDSERTPHLGIDIKEYDTKCLESLAKLLSFLSHENFIEEVLKYLEKGFLDVDKEAEFFYLLEKIGEYDGKFKNKDVLCVKPTDLMR
jgi:spore coat protein CotH